MNEFEKQVQSQNHDVIDSIKGFGFSFLFFFIIFFIGVVFEVVAKF
ncbi:YqzM family protein [Salinibacillus xinjiangensis]|uniref:YqzM family protein n=1 Tax=Salinibacillus xinjiangensis TaxID=1229268 RepID=A0A6G1X6X4_9BACI|nr:YqzM family protein [Salinibacillus xinjiangensis]MRG86656.1 YqzM family protein [Salinibacillus xinjiangensis]